MAVNVDNLRPWEWAICESDVYWLVRTLRAEFDDTRRTERRTLAKMREQAK